MTIGPGTPSAEGPLVTKEAQSYSFRTYAPLHIDDHGCAWATRPASRSRRFLSASITRSTRMSYKDAMLTIQPELPGRFGEYLWQYHANPGRQQGPDHLYGHGQRQHPGYLWADTGPGCPPDLQGWPGGPGSVRAQERVLSPSTRRPKSRPFPCMRSIIRGWTCKVYAVQPADWPAYKQYLQEYQRTDVHGAKSRVGWCWTRASRWKPPPMH